MTRVAEPLAVVVPAAGPVVAVPDDLDGIGEARDDGMVVGVTAGWLRASRLGPAPESTLVRPAAVAYYLLAFGSDDLFRRQPG